MTTEQLAKCASNCFKGTHVVFEDKSGNLDEIYTAIRVRYSGGMPMLILKETFADEFEFKVDKNPPLRWLTNLNNFGKRTIKHTLSFIFNFQKFLSKKNIYLQKNYFMKPLPARIFHQWSRQTFCSLAWLGSLRSHKVLVTLEYAPGVYFLQRNSGSCAAQNSSAKLNTLRRSR